MKVLVPVVETPDGRMMVAPHFGGATAFVIIEVGPGGECRVVKRMEAGGGPGGKGRAVMTWAYYHGVDAAVARTMGRGAYENLRAAGIPVYYAESLDPCEAARAVAEGRARPLSQDELLEGMGRGRGGGWGRRGW